MALEMTIDQMRSAAEEIVTSHTRDHRWELRMICEAMYRHDEVSLLNLLEIALAMLNGAPRPAYLSRGDEEAGVHAAIVA